MKLLPLYRADPDIDAAITRGKGFKNILKFRKAAEEGAIYFGALSTERSAQCSRVGFRTLFWGGQMP